jgi:outer membrane protein assembly factor BamB
MTQGTRELRVWPGVAAMAITWGGRIVVDLFLPQYAIFGLLGGVAGGLAVLVWWLLFSRAPAAERLGAVVLIVAAMYGAMKTPGVLDRSILGGMMGRMFPIASIPVFALALVVWAAATRRMGTGLRSAALVAAVAAAVGVGAAVRTDGITGEGKPQLVWRWSETPEERLLKAGGPAALLPSPPAAPAVETARPAEASPAPVAAVATTAAPAIPQTRAEWPGFRGPGRDSAAPGVRIKTEWTATPPVELWRRPVGPGWSSFAVGNGRIYTQEQRGDFEVVACYKAATGEPVWAHRDTGRFYESNGGAGPRGTPALHEGRVYTFGATGILNALDAATGAVVWTRNAKNDTEAKTPGWGFASSPLVVGDVLIVAASGRLAGYERATGAPRWMGPKGGGSYSSPHLLTIAGVPQVVLMSDTGATSVSAADGSVLWTHVWPGSAMLQPAMTEDGAVLVTTGDSMGGLGLRRLSVTQGAGGWKVEETWTSPGLKPYFNDFVVHAGHAYGFDGSILSCIDLKDGQRKWKGGRYGHGQMLLLRDQDLLLVLSEEGGLALVSATPGEFREVAKFPAMDDKTWNHPALVGDVLVVRNGREMVAFRLPVGGT